LQLDYLLMQNPDHLDAVVAAANLAPLRPRGADFARVREAFLDGVQRHLRHTVVLSAVATPEGNALLSRRACNARGGAKTAAAHRGALRHVLAGVHARHTFHRLPDAATLAEADEARFALFRDHLLRRLVAASQSHTLVVVPSYMQFVRLRRLLNKEDASWQECTEYSSVTQARPPTHTHTTSPSPPTTTTTSPLNPSQPNAFHHHLPISPPPARDHVPNANSLRLSPPPSEAASPSLVPRSRPAHVLHVPYLAHVPYLPRPRHPITIRTRLATQPWHGPLTNIANWRRRRRRRRRRRAQVAHARSSLFHGRCDLLVMTERFHFYHRFRFMSIYIYIYIYWLVMTERFHLYHRFRLRGVHHVLFYGLPLFPRFYPELVNLVSLGAGAAVSVTAIYARQDMLALQRVVGSARAQRMLDSDKSVHMFA
jgi:hypothetical protein